MKNNSLTPYILVLAISFFIVFGGWFMVSSGRNIVMGNSAKNWPHVTGRLHDFSPEAANTSEGGTAWSARVRYAYTVGGRNYEGTTIHPTYNYASSSTPEQSMISKLETAQEVKVYYDASKPARSTLSVGFHSSSLAIFFASIMFFAGGIGMLLPVLRFYVPAKSPLINVKYIIICSLYSVGICFLLTIFFLIAGSHEYASSITVIRKN